MVVHQVSELLQYTCDLFDSIGDTYQSLARICIVPIRVDELRRYGHSVDVPSELCTANMQHLYVLIELPNRCRHSNSLTEDLYTLAEEVLMGGGADLWERWRLPQYGHEGSRDRRLHDQSREREKERLKQH